ncbi:MAG: restriction endonuclease subunit S [Chitinophagales bacterium]|nr:restriction endonuclease subunit S [Chitinophagales bacterium]
MEKMKIKELYYFSPKTKVKAGEGKDKGQIPLYTSSQVQNKFVDKQTHSGQYLIFGTGGSPSIHWVFDRFAVSTDCYVIGSKQQKVNIKYTYYYLQSNMQILERGFKGAGLKHISKAFLEEIEIPFPDLETQDKIVAILDKAKAILDKREQTIKKYDELLRAMFLEMFGDPVKNEKGWTLKRMSEVSQSRLGKMLDSKKNKGINSKRYLRNTNVQWLKFDFNELLEMDFDENERLEFDLQYGDVLLCEGGEIGRCAIWKDEIADIYFQKALHRIRFNLEYILPTYFVYMFWLYAKIGGLKKFMGAATISHLTGEKLKDLNIVVPPIELQEKFTIQVTKIEMLKSKVEDAKSNINYLINALSQLAFKGQLDFNTAVDLEVLLENDYDFFKENSNSSSINLLLERLNTDELNENRFNEQQTYDKAKSFVFELIKEGKVKQIFDEKTKKVKLTV